MASSEAGAAAAKWLGAMADACQSGRGVFCRLLGCGCPQAAVRINAAHGAREPLSSRTLTHTTRLGRRLFRASDTPSGKNQARTDSRAGARTDRGRYGKIPWEREEHGYLRDAPKRVRSRRLGTICCA
ncbi:hypothetical protein HPB50_016929 [Hyalomma asiaticum]|uniref:Uncharacterized protein n=1 Tax=Hyalomma asiaticum TaxID=266040 RepID=A0ACB7SZM2_HYAAI|nr:hypothetical protein HPB50_016929 [Hyalomma asiaticum]